MATVRAYIRKREDTIETKSGGLGNCTAQDTYAEEGTNDGQKSNRLEN